VNFGISPFRNFGPI